MLRETEHLLFMHMEFLPLKSYDRIHEGNALRMNWNDVVPSEELDYIMSNPPFVGSKYSSPSQKSDMDYVFGKYTKKYRLLDYVTSWYVKAAQYIEESSTCCYLSRTF